MWWKTALLIQYNKADAGESIFMVISGLTLHGRTNNVEEIKMNSSQENGCPVPNGFPVTIYGAVGANMSEHKQIFF